MKTIFNIFVILIVLTSQLPAQVTGLSGWNIYLDPGHSQKENMGIYGYSEAERNLRVALRLREMLLETTDIDTVFISRTTDFQQVALSQRTSHANSVGASWFHSIHSDAAASTTANSTLLLWGQYRNGQEKNPNGGKAMSDIMIDVLTRGMRTNTRGSIGDCSFYGCSGNGPYLSVNRNSSMPSELSEAGFHTNPRQNQLFMGDRWKILEAKTFYWSILKFFGIEQPTEGIVSGVISDIETGVPANGVVVTIENQKDTTDTYESLFHKYTNDPNLLHNGFYYIANLPNQNLQIITKSEFYYSDTLEITPSETFFTFKDFRLINKVPPTVISSEPENGEINVEPWDDITLKFSRKMNHQTVMENLEITPNVNYSVIWSYGYSKLVIKMDTLSYVTEYTVKIPATARDRYDHPFDGNGDGVGGDDYILTFVTGSEDREAPNVVALYPLIGAENVEAPFIINMVFDERINPNSITDDNFKLKCVPTAKYVKGNFSHHYINERSVMSFFPTDEILPSTQYAARLFSGVTDVFGNATDQYETFSFQTTDKQFEKNKIDLFESSFLSNWWAPTRSPQTVGVISSSTYITVNQDQVNLLSQSSSSLQLNYGWQNSATEWFIRLYLEGGSPKNVTFDDSHILQCYVLGDGSSNKFRFCLDDKVPNSAYNNHEVSPWYIIDWFGWKLVSWDLREGLTGTWLGDGNLDGTLRFDSFQFTHEVGDTESGTLIFDDLQFVKELPTKIINDEQPLKLNDFVLKQNYPNPFNSATIFNFFITEPSLVKLEVFNTIGQRISVLSNEYSNAGEKSVRWVPELNLGSGIYYYQISVKGKNEKYNKLGKMLYLK